MAIFAAWLGKLSGFGVGALGPGRGRPGKHAATNRPDKPCDKCVADQNGGRLWGVGLFISCRQEVSKKNARGQN
jgi:hypothetical protein